MLNNLNNALSLLKSAYGTANHAVKALNTATNHNLQPLSDEQVSERATNIVNSPDAVESVSNLIRVSHEYFIDTFKVSATNRASQGSLQSIMANLEQSLSLMEIDKQEIESDIASYENLISELQAEVEQLRAIVEANSASNQSFPQRLKNLFR